MSAEPPSPEERRVAYLEMHLGMVHKMGAEGAAPFDGDWDALVQEHGQQHETGFWHLHEGQPDYFADYRSPWGGPDDDEDEDDEPHLPWLLNGPRSWRWPIWLLDELLDRVPCYEEGRWYRKGGWGCRMRLHRWWLDRSEWETS